MSHVNNFFFLKGQGREGRKKEEMSKSRVKQAGPGKGERR
jgi:hypothetical protein